MNLWTVRSVLEAVAAATLSVPAAEEIIEDMMFEERANARADVDYGDVP